jgi:hypothetical protein
MSVLTSYLTLGYLSLASFLSKNKKKLPITSSRARPAGAFSGSVPLPILLWTTCLVSWSYFHYFYEGTLIFEDFYCNHLYFSHCFTWEHGFGPLVSHAHCICTWYCASPLFSTHGLGGRLTYLRKAFLSFVTRVWKIREISFDSFLFC